MVRGGSVRAAMLFAAAFVIGSVCLSARASRAADDEDSRFILFSGRDIWANGVFMNGGLLFAPGGFEQDGFVFKLVIGSGAYRYNTDNVSTGRVIGFESTLQILPGFRIKRGNLEMKFFLGLDFEKHWLWPYDPQNALQGSDTGLRMAAEFWYEPTPTTMAAFEASISTIATNHSMRAAFGFRVLQEQFYFGPEIAYFGSDGYRHLRLGGHFTALKTERIEWSAAGGWAGDSGGRVSPYARLGLFQRL